MYVEISYERENARFTHKVKLVGYSKLPDIHDLNPDRELIFEDMLGKLTLKVRDIVSLKAI